ncbi:MAG TPA: hypothetical protein VM737_03255 [Gemmatimonadota bacterium]|nr:hypothetical protein [Gemmatimonadota bacterium]
MRSRTLLALIPVIAALAVGCPRPEPEEEEPADDITEPEEALPGSGWIDSTGGLVEIPSGQACVEVPPGAVLRDSTRITIQRLSPSDSTLPRTLEPAFDRPGGPRVLPPMYEITADPWIEFAVPVTVGICVAYAAGEAPWVETTRLAHPDPDDRDTLELLPQVPPCELRCRGGPGQSGAAGARATLRELLTGSPLTATSLYAETAFRGIGGGAGTLSPFAAVVPDTTPEAGSATAP